MWKVKHARTSCKELAKLPPKVRAKVEEVAFGEALRRTRFLVAGCRGW